MLNRNGFISSTELMLHTTIAMEIEKYCLQDFSTSLSVNVQLFPDNYPDSIPVARPLKPINLDLQQECMMIRLSNGDVIRSLPLSQIMVKDKDYKVVEDLCIGDDLYQLIWNEKDEKFEEASVSVRDCTFIRLPESFPFYVLDGIDKGEFYRLESGILVR